MLIHFFFVNLMTDFSNPFFMGMFLKMIEKLLLMQNTIAYLLMNMRSQKYIFYLFCSNCKY